MVGGGIFAKGCGESWRFLMGFGAEDVACEGRCVVEGWPGRNLSRSQNPGMRAGCANQSARMAAFRA